MPHLHHNKYSVYLTRYSEIRPVQNCTGSRTFTLQTCQRKPNSDHISYILSFAEVSKEKKIEERGGKGKRKGRLGERRGNPAIKPFQDGRRQGVGANFRTT